MVAEADLVSFYIKPLTSAFTRQVVSPTVRPWAGLAMKLTKEQFKNVHDVLISDVQSAELYA